ncbi:MAG: hypothetical protein ACRCYZ_04900 [Alphaproteobacteria bacterium]
MNKNNKLTMSLISTLITTSVVFAMNGSGPAATSEDLAKKTPTAAPSPAKLGIAAEDPNPEAKAAYETKLAAAQEKLEEAKIPDSKKLKELNEIKAQIAEKQKELLDGNKAIQIASQKIAQTKAAETKRLQDVAKKTATAKAAAAKAKTEFVEPTEDVSLKTAYETKLKEAEDALTKAKETVETKTEEMEKIKDALTLKQAEYSITHKAVLAEQSKIAKLKTAEVNRTQDVAKKAALKTAQDKAAALKTAKSKIEKEKTATLQTKLDQELVESEEAEKNLKLKITEEEAAKQRIKEEEEKIAAAQRSLEEIKKAAEIKHAETEEAKKIAIKEKQESDAAEKQLKQNQKKQNQEKQNQEKKKSKK